MRQVVIDMTEHVFEAFYAVRLQFCAVFSDLYHSVSVSRRCFSCLVETCQPTISEAGGGTPEIHAALIPICVSTILHRIADRFFACK